MAANTLPIYSAKGTIQWGAQYSGSPFFGVPALVTGNNSYEGTGSGVMLVVSASAEGNFIQRLRFKASGSTTGSVARIFINNGNGLFNATSSNNFLYDEVTLPAVTATSGSATTTIEVPMNFVLPASYRITATIGTTQTVGGWFVGAIGGSYQQ